MQMIINGAKVDASDKSVIEITNPYTGKVIGTVPNATEKDVDKAVNYAKKAQPKWAQVPVWQKVEIFKEFLNLVDLNKAALAKVLCQETGKPLKQAKAEIANIRIGFEGFMEKAKHLYGNVIPYGTEQGQEKTLQYTQREPLGVVAAIIPFNFPCDLFDQKIAPALLAGNSVIVKPPHQNPSALIMLTDLLNQAGVTKGAIQIITGRGSKCGAALSAHPGVDKITFTGSTEVGIITAKYAAEKLAQTSLELGGNDAYIVCDDADINLAVEEVVWGRMYNTGQVCCASKRFLVQKGVHAEFVKKLTARLKKLKQGDPMTDVDLGTLISEEDAIHVENQVKLIIKQGGKLVLGGKRNGAMYPATIVDNVPKTADVAGDEEIFGPVVPIIEFKTIDEAIEIANASKFGLCGCVFTKDAAKALKVANALQCGGVVINGASFHRSFEMPFGGYKFSGIGGEGVMSTFDEMTHTKTITLKNIIK